MAELFCQLMYSDLLISQQGDALWRALSELNRQMRPWSSDDYELPGETLRRACHRGELIFVAMEATEWLLNADWDTGSLIVSGDLELGGSASSQERLNGLIDVLDTLVYALRPRFGWADLEHPYPKGLTQAVLDTRINWIFWLNYYGRPYIEKYGIDFFLTAPFHNVHRLNHEAVRCIAATTPTQNLDALRKESLLNYFAAKSMSVMLYR
jgi:hypothetical protein